MGRGGVGWGGVGAGCLLPGDVCPRFFFFFFYRFMGQAAHCAPAGIQRGYHPSDSAA